MAIAAKHIESPKKPHACNNIPVRNIYFMMCYAWDSKHLLSDCPVDTDGEFENVIELVSFLLAREASRLVKSGFKRGYIQRTNALGSPRGHINMQPSFELLSQRQMKLNCTYSEYSSDIALNQIIAWALRHTKCKNAKTNKMIRRVLPFFNDIAEKPPTPNVLNALSFDRTNIRYRLIVNLCRFLYERVLPSEKAGSSRFDEAECGRYLANIFEGFIRAYYSEWLQTNRLHKYRVSPGNKQVCWALEERAPAYMPAMYSDVWIEKDRGARESELFIVDAKFYQDTLNNYGTFWSHNLYQIQGYMLNAKMSTSVPFTKVHGCLLYPKTERSINEDIQHQIGTISIRTVDLNRDWQQILHEMRDIWQSLDIGSSQT